MCYSLIILYFYEIVNKKHYPAYVFVKYRQTAEQQNVHFRQIRGSRQSTALSVSTAFRAVFLMARAAIRAAGAASAAGGSAGAFVLVQLSSGKKQYDRDDKTYNYSGHIIPAFHINRRAGYQPKGAADLMQYRTRFVRILP